MRFVILLMLATSAYAADPFAKALADFQTADELTDYCGEENDPQSVVCRAAASSVTAEDAAKDIARNLGVTNESARAIGFASLALMNAGFQPKLDDATQRAAHDALANAAKHETHRAPIFVVMAQLAEASDDPRSRYEEMLPLLHAESDPVQAAIAVCEAVASNDALAILLGDAFARHPDNATLLDAIGERSSGAIMRATLGGAGVRLQAIAELGLPNTLIAAFEALPPNARASLPDEVRLDVAAAAILANKAQLARQIVPAAIPPLLAFALSDGRGDFFDVIAAMPSGVGVQGQLYSLLLERHGYPQFAAEVLRDSAWSRDPEANDIAPAFRDATAPLQRLVDAAAASERSRAALLAPQSPQSSSLLRLINRPRIVPFTEHALVDVEKSDPATLPTIVVDCSDAEIAAAAMHLPAFGRAIRIESNGSDVVAITSSGSVDPTGELGLDGYWIFRSNDGGETWSRYYTGLRANSPYVIPAESALPILNGDHLRIEVEVQELDRASITFPPIATRIARSQKGLYLDFAWDALTRDSDGDGITDLLEEHLVIDPNDPDTDGDGIADGVDALPQVACDGQAAAASEVLEVVLAAVGQEDFTTFLVADRAQFATLTPAGRAIVLTDEELEAYTKKFGPTYAARISHFVIDHTGTRAIIDLNHSWTGATYKLTKTEDGWIAEVLSSWIT